MSRGRSGIGTELVPLVLILASLAGSLALVIAIHRRFVARTTAEKPPVAVIAPPVLTPPRPAPIATVRPVVPEPEVEEPEPPPPPPPEDPTPKVIARLMSAEAEQLLEASKADRKTAELEAARKSALLESERWRRRESLVRLQLDSLETKVHKLETQADELALERDALERELDSRKALAAESRSRPSTAILPHRGQNGTWRRPIVVECVNGMAIIRPQNLSFGLLELSMGFGPSTNPFVAAVAREAIRIQGNLSPDGQLVTPYIFFLVRPDGIRTYYEARGRLEPLGITFGYELADQDWEIDFPDLDDLRTWDGSAPPKPRDPLARTLPSRPPGGSPAEDEGLFNFGPGSGTRNAPAGDAGPGGEFTWPTRPRTGLPPGGRVSLGGNGSGSSPMSGGIGSPGGNGLPGGPGASGSPGASNPTPGPYASGGGAIKFPGGTSGAVEPGAGSGPKPSTGPGDLPTLAPPRELSLGGPVTPLPPALPGSPNPPGNPGGSPPPSLNRLAQGLNVPPPASQTLSADPTGPATLPPVMSPRTSQPMGSNLPGTPPSGSSSDPSDPANAFVFPSPSSPDLTAQPRGSSGGTSSPSFIDPNQTPPVRHVGPFSKPLSGIDPSLIANSSNPPGPTSPPAEVDPTQPDNLNGTANPNASSRSTNGSTRPNSSQQPGTTASQSTRVLGPGDSSSPPPDSSGSPPPPLTLGLGTPGPPPPLTFPMGSPPSSMNPPPPSTSTSNPAKPTVSPPPLDNSRNLARKYEIVVVCNAHGVIVQPGAYRVTADALKNRDGLLRTQIVALVKARRTVDPQSTIEPSVRFLVQPGGESTYWSAKGQFLLSGLDWPMTTQVADRDHLSILPTESW